MEIALQEREHAKRKEKKKDNSQKDEAVMDKCREREEEQGRTLYQT